MKRRIKYPLIATLFLALGVTSCSEDFLQPEPLSFFAPENVYVNPGGFEALLVTMRKTLSDAEFTGGRGSSLNMGQWSETGAGIGRWLPNRDILNASGTGRIAYYEQVSMSEEAYEYIRDANVVISRIDNIEWEDQARRNAILAEAYWHRAYWYNRLVHSYGDVPFVGEEIRSARIDFRTHTREAILDKIQEDLEFAVQHMTDAPIPGQPGVAAGNHLLAKVYLANRQYADARDTATEVINGPHALMTERFGQDAGDPKHNVIWDLHRPMNKNLPANTETILAIVDRFEAPQGARDGNGLRTMRTYHPDWWHSRNRDSEGNRGMIDEGPVYDSLGRGNPDVVLSEFYQYFIWEEAGFTWEDTPDMRRSDHNWKDVHEMTYNNPASADFGEPWTVENSTESSDYDNLATMYAMPIYKTMIPEGNPDSRPQGGNGDWYVYRLAETYLIRAEANYWMDDLDAAADDINAVRERANAPLIGPGDVTIDYIMDERVRELFAEGTQHNELVRVSFTMAEEGEGGYSPETLHQDNYWYDRLIAVNPFYPEHTTYAGRASISIGPTVEFPIGDQFGFGIGLTSNINPHNFLWPIYDDMIEANVLGRVNQNFGYDGYDNNEPPLETIE